VSDIREARAEDASDIVRLVAQLDYAIDEAGAEARRQRLAGRGEPLLVAEADGKIAGLLNWHVMETIHRPRPVGRIVTLVVDEPVRGTGVGRMLMAEAERRMRQAGCGLLEVTSNVRLADAHRFYERLGLERTSCRFAKTL
jgi:GNAT superfamily N-acetyltransferase